ncbi:rhodopsin, GQ-coupled-like [Bolinopsis microptera]|uniref:rhodopsin, GQ-coupled-like n=1 Tax=Bolinopsis microptera TaxID=2820187 RepID=UPI00307ADD62
MSLRKVKMAVPVIWIVCFFLVMPPFFGWSRYALSQPLYTCGLDLNGHPADKYYILVYSLITFPLPIILIVFCYASITLNVTRHFKRRNKFSKVLDGVKLKNNSQPSNDSDERGINRKIRSASTVQKKEQMKVAISILVVVMTLIVTVFPIMCISLAVLFGCSTCQPSTRYIVAAHWVNVGRSSANPLIFGIANKPIRDAYR